MVTDNIKKMAKSRGLSIRDLEKELGFAIGAISAWRMCNPGIENVVRIADFLDCDVDDLVVRENRKKFDFEACKKCDEEWRKYVIH